MSAVLDAIDAKIADLDARRALLVAMRAEFAGDAAAPSSPLPPPPRKEC